MDLFNYCYKIYLRKELPAVLFYLVINRYITDDEAHTLNIKANDLLLNLPQEDWISVFYCVTSDFKWAELKNLITIEKYLQLSLAKRKDLQYIFSKDGQKALEENIITLEKFLNMASQDRESLKILFTDNARQCIRENIITIEKFLSFDIYQRKKLNLLFQKENLILLKEKIISMQEFLNSSIENPSEYLDEVYDCFYEIKKILFIFAQVNLIKKIPSIIQFNITNYVVENKTNNSGINKYLIKKFFQDIDSAPFKNIDIDTDKIFKL